MVDHVSITKWENENSIAFEKGNAEFNALFIDSFNLFGEAISESQNQLSKDTDSDFHKVYLSMGLKIISDIRAIFYTTKSGWYATSHSLFREINDASVTIALIARSPDFAKRIIYGKLSNNQIKKKADELKLIAPLDSNTWHRLSSIKHAEGEEILAWYGEHRDDKVQLRLFPTFDIEQARTITLFSSALLVQVAQYYKEFHICHYGSDFVDAHFPERASSLVAKITEVIKSEINSD